MSDLEVLIENGVATLVMNRPEARNALSMDMRKQLAEKLHEIELDSQIRCVVLKGAGDHFMAGGDVKGMGESIKKSPQEIRKEFMLRIHDLHPIMFAMRRMPKPIIASCRGAAAGAGGHRAAPGRASQRRHLHQRCAVAGPCGVGGRGRRALSAARRWPGRG